MDISKLLYTLNQLQVKFQLMGDRLKICFPEHNISDEIIDMIKENKEKIIEFLRKIKEQDKYLSIRPLEKREYYDLSPGQRRFWLLEQLGEEKDLYNIYLSLSLKENIDVESFEQVIALMIQRHEILRTIFILVSSQPKQKILDKIKIPFEYLDYSSDRDKRELSDSEIGKKSYKKFNLQKGPLFKMVLVKRTDYDYLLILNIHHIIFDRVSMEVLKTDLRKFYASLMIKKPAALREMRIQYRDYSVWLNNVLRGDKRIELEKYWLTVFSGKLPALEIPGADNRSVRPKHMDTKKLIFVIDQERTGVIELFCRKHAITLFMLMLGIIYVLMYKYTGQNDIVFTSFISGRVHEDLETLIGYFVNRLAFKIKMNSSETFLDLIHHIKVVTLNAFEHQLYPFEDLVDKLDIKRDRGRLLFSKIRIDVDDSLAELAGLQDKPELTQKAETLQSRELFHEDLYFSFSGYGGKIFTLMEYISDMFSQSRIDLLKHRFIYLIDTLITNHQYRLSEVDFDFSGKNSSDIFDVEFDV